MPLAGGDGFDACWRRSPARMRPVARCATIPHSCCFTRGEVGRCGLTRKLHLHPVPGTQGVGKNKRWPALAMIASKGAFQRAANSRPGRASAHGIEGPDKITGPPGRGRVGARTREACFSLRGRPREPGRGPDDVWAPIGRPANSWFRSRCPSCKPRHHKKRPASLVRSTPPPENVVGGSSGAG